MKKYQISSLLFMWLFLASCVDDLTNKAGKESYTFTAQIENENPTRTMVNEQNQVLWVEGDEIGVFGELQSKNERFTLQSSEGTSGQFTGQLGSGEQVDFAYYPYQEDAELNGSTLTMTLPSEYTYTGNSNAPMLGFSNGENSLSFKHLCGLMKVTVTDVPENSVRFVVTSENKIQHIAGTAIVEDIHTATAAFAIKDGGNASQTITYSLSGDASEKELTFFIPLPAGEYDKLTVSLRSADDKVLFQKSISNAVIRRAVLLSMPTLVCDEDISYVLADHTIQLTQEDELYIQSVTPEGDETSDNNVITYISDTPEDKLPKAGQVLLYSEMTDKFPSGFLGKVISVEKMNSGYAVHTESAALDEAFDKLYMDKTFDLIPDGDRLTQTRLEISQIDIVQDEDGFYSLRVSVQSKEDRTLIFNGTLELSAKAQYKIAFDNKSQTQPTAMIKLFSKVSTADFEFGVHKKDNEEKTIVIPIWSFPVRVNPAFMIITPTVDLSFIIKLKGDIGINTELNLQRISTETLKLENGKWIRDDSAQNENSSLNFEPSGNITIEGSIFGGFGVGLYLKILNNDKKKMGIEPQIGFRATGEVSVDWDDFDGNLYDMFKDTKMEAGLGVNIDAEITKIFENKSIENFERKPIFQFNLLHPYYLFPSFDTPALEVDNEKRAVKVNYLVNRDLIFKSNIGMNLYDENNLILKTEQEEYIREGEYENPLTATFNDLSTGIKYTVLPYVQLGNWTFDATPKEQFTFEGDEKDDPQPGGSITVISVNSTDITKTSATLSGLIPDADLDGTYEYGFIYGTTELPTAENSTIVKVNTMKEDGSFSSTLTSLVENTVYYWRAYVCDSDGNYFYGDVQTFTTIEFVPGEGSERDILIAFYKSTGGDHWKRNDNWCSDAPLKDWYGVYTEEEYNPNPATAGSEKVKQIILDNNNLTGIAVLNGLTELENISFQNNQLSGIGLTETPSLTGIHITDNRIRSIDIANLKDKLEVLDCDENSLTDLQIAGFNKLQRLNCGDNQLTELDLTGCINLSSLNCSSNQLNDLDVTKLTKLRGLNCNNNDLTSLYVPDINDLSTLYCQNNPLKSLEINGCINLDILGFGGGSEANISSFNASRFVNLSQLRIGSCKLNSLNVSMLQKLRILSCMDNELTNLDVSDLKEVDMLLLDNNQLKNLDLSNLNKMTVLSCDNNQLTQLDVSMLNNLSKLECMNNQLIELKIAPSMSELYCENNQLTSLDMSVSTEFKATSAIYCDNNKLETIYLSSSQEYLISKFPVWGEQNSYIYKEPYHWNGYQYPEFIYK